MDTCKQFNKTNNNKHTFRVHCTELVSPSIQKKKWKYKEKKIGPFAHRQAITKRREQKMYEKIIIIDEKNGFAHGLFILRIFLCALQSACIHVKPCVCTMWATASRLKIVKLNEWTTLYHNNIFVVFWPKFYNLIYSPFRIRLFWLYWTEQCAVCLRFFVIERTQKPYLFQKIGKYINKVE